MKHLYHGYIFYDSQDQEEADRLKEVFENDPFNAKIYKSSEMEIAKDSVKEVMFDFILFTRHVEHSDIKELLHTIRYEPYIATLNMSVIEDRKVLKLVDEQIGDIEAWDYEKIFLRKK